MPLRQSIRELDPAPRRFLLFTLFNVISWQCIVGPALILLAREIGMPASWVGGLISVMPFSTMMVVVTVPLVMRVGSKRLMGIMWVLRNLAACTIFALPWAMARWGPRSGWYVVLAAVVGFCLLRAMASGSWFPWLHEIVPEAQRGAYFSAEAGVAHLVGVALMLVQALILSGKPDLGRYLTIYALGIAAGLVSVWLMLRIPGGRGVPDALRGGRVRAAWRAVLTDRGYLRYVFVAMCCFSATSWLGSALVLYLRDALFLGERTIMLMMALGGLCILLTIQTWGRYADHAGSASTMALTLFGHALAGFICLVSTAGVDEPPAMQAFWPVAAAIVVVGTGSVFGAAFWMAAHRATLNYVQEEGRVAYTSVWTLSIAISLGVTPILVGQAIERFGLAGFQTCFLISGLAGLAGAVACRLVVKDRRPLPGGLAALINPELPVRTLARLVWITCRRHPSSRNGGLP